MKKKFDKSVFKIPENHPTSSDSESVKQMGIELKTFSFPIER